MPCWVSRTLVARALWIWVSAAWPSRWTFPKSFPRASWPSCRSEEHTSELQSQSNLVCRLLLEKKKVLTTALTLHTHIIVHPTPPPLSVVMVPDILENYVQQTAESHNLLFVSATCSLDRPSVPF